MTIDYLVQQVDGTSRFTLQDGTGFLLLQSSTVIIAATNKNDVFLKIHHTGDVETFFYGNDDSKIYLNSIHDIGVLA